MKGLHLLTKFLIVVLCLLGWCKGFTLPRGEHSARRTEVFSLLRESPHKKPFQRLHSTKQPLNFYADDELRSKVSQLIDYMVEQESVLAIDPYFLESFLPALCKGNVYNQVMRKKLQKEGMTDDEFEKYKQIDSFLKGYISQKVKKKNRETVQDLLSSAAAGPEELDLKMGAAAEQGKLDASCLSYVRELVRGEEAKAAGRSAGDPALLLRVLRLLQDRIEAELRMADRPELRALSHLVRIPDEADREAAVRKSFTNRDGFLRFREFLRDGMEYFLNKGAGTLAVSNRLPQDSVERMNHILDVVNDILKREYGGV
mmetsp:Transcript_38532/g.66830  ORF Transcript_38532/g.66830 Transcript_38532/m.66830 type:complete len:315 (-) Transcript_38532:106-1050(-)